MKKNIKIAQIVALAIVALSYAVMRAAPQPKAAPSTGGFYYVEHAVDGDTLKLSGGERVRLIGVDTPEAHYSNKLLRDARRSRKDVRSIQAFGRKSSSFTRSLCAGKKVRLEFDVVKRDKYGRLLAYVYLEDGTLVNARILEEGFGQVMTIPPNVKHADYFLKLQKTARLGNKGLWGEGALSDERP